MGMYFSEADHQRIAQAIRAVEERSSGEIVCVVARACEPYMIIAALWSLLIGMLTGGLLALIGAGVSLAELVGAQSGAALLAYLVLQYLPLRMALVPRAVKLRRAERLARTQFLEQGLHRTSWRTGILIFAAMAEHHVEIIADAGINAVVEPDVWDTIVQGFTTRMKQGQTIDAFIGAIEAAGAELEQHFPRQSEGGDELPDHLIEI